jgi:hypothetical protein
MNDIIKETSICRIHEGRPVQFPFFRLFGGATLTEDHLILIPVIRTPKYYGSLVIRVTQPDKSCIQRVPLEVKIYALEQMFDI